MIELVGVVNMSLWWWLSVEDLTSLSPSLGMPPS